MEYIELSTLCLVAANTFLLVKHDAIMKRQICQAVREVLEGRKV